MAQFRFSVSLGKQINGETGNIIFPIAPLVGKRGNRESIYTVGIYSRFTDSPQVRKVRSAHRADEILHAPKQSRLMALYELGATYECQGLIFGNRTPLTGKRQRLLAD